MSYTTIAQAVVDDALIKRVRAAVAKEAYSNAELRLTSAGQQILRQGPDPFLNRYMWATAIASEVAYAYAVASSNPDPGNDPAVISDASITSVVQANWPSDSVIQAPYQYLQVVPVVGPPV